MGTPKTRPAILAYLIKHAGKPVMVDDIMKSTGFTLTQVQSQMRNMITDGLPIITLAKAQIWQYNGQPEPEPETHDVNGDVFEGIGRTKSGAIIVRDMNGILYVCREMDV